MIYWICKRLKGDWIPGGAGQGMVMGAVDGILLAVVVGIIMICR